MGAAHEPADARWFTASLSPTPIAREYLATQRALRRTEARDVRFEPGRHEPALVDRARAWWLGMMRAEYESASVFVDLAMHVRELDDPVDVQGVVLRMAQDELRHADVCARVVEAMGGQARTPATPPRRAARHPDCSPEESTLRNVIYGCCLTELVNVARFVQRIEGAADPFVRDALRQLLADERLHAQFGFHYLEWRRDWLRERPEVRRSLARYLRFAFAVLEREMGLVPAGARPATPAERALGLPDLADVPETFQQTIVNASIPALEALGIDAEVAWRDRSAA
jgi:hypothetical protein